MALDDISWTMGFSKTLEDPLVASVRVQAKQDQAAENMPTMKVMTGLGMISACSVKTTMLNERDERRIILP